MDPSEWMSRFKLTHEQAKANKLNEQDKRLYMEMREELARSLVASQSLQVPEGQFSRKHFRVAQMYKIEIDRTYQTVTKMVSRSGFQVTLPTQLKVGQVCEFSLMLGREGEPLTGKAKVVSATKQGSWQVSFSIDVIGEENGDRLETALFDAVLSRFK